ncbi:MAG: aspartate aminotransferase family protein [Verrucomicrobia bacterium]|nr:MAG: aspartate aminotransferase family protein [Verrucomicrobiota bacterium]
MSSILITQTAAEAAYDSYVLRNYGRPAITLARGEGCRVWDDAGNRYLDFASGIAVNAVGHCHPRWVKAVSEQASTLVHVSNLFRNPLQGELAKRLVAHAGPGRVFFCNSGAEANEALLKLARLHGIRKSGEEGKSYTVLCAKSAFHGRTFGGMSATPQEKIQKGFRPLVPGFAFGEMNNLASFEALITENTCAIFIESIQGEGGIHPATTEFLLGLRELCNRHNLLLLLDEVQCGIGRTGKFFAFDHAGVRPDAIGMAKGLGGGFPIGAIWVGEGAADLFQPGMHGTTFGGTPLACAAALATLDIIQDEGLCEKIACLSGPWHAALATLAVEFPAQCSGVRGIGFMVGLQLTSDPVPYVAAARNAGLLAPLAGGNVLRLLPPLVAGADELAEAVAILRSVFAAKAAAA